MPAGNLTLLEAAKSGTDKLKTGVIQTIIQESPIIERIPWMPFAGNALQHEVEELLPQVQFRDVNAGYTKSFGTTSMYYWGVAILGGEVMIDNYLVNVTATRQELKAKQFAMLAKANALRFDYEFFNGDGSNSGFKGVKQLISEGFGQKYDHNTTTSTTGAPLTLDTLDVALDLFRNQGGPAEILGPRGIRRQLTKLARATVTGNSFIDWERNAFGKQVMTWDGIPYTILGDVVDGTGALVPALPFTETNGSAANTASVYMIKWGADNVTGLLGKGGDFGVHDFGETQAGPQHLGRMEWYPGIAIFNKYSVVRIAGITAS